jgi:8-oxo-dGTP pyrophosphatase MutT (NUDIX family)
MKFHRSLTDPKGWRVRRETVCLDTPHLQVVETEVETPARPAGCSWTVVHRKAAVVVAPITSQGHLVLVRQERIAVRGTLWEFPAGQIDEAGEIETARVLETAFRELREETGCQLSPGGEMIPLGMFHSSVGFTDEHAYLWLARPVQQAGRRPGATGDEAIVACRTFTRDEFLTMIATGEIHDANTLSTFARLVAMGLW